MAIDIKTLILIVGIYHLMQVLVFYHQYRANKNVMGPGWWLMWSAAECLAFGLILLRSIPSLLPVVIIFQDIIILSGTVFIYIGAVRFFEKKVNRRFCIIFLVCFITLHLFFAIVKNDITIRTIILSAFLSAISFITAISIHKNKTKSVALTANFSIIVFIVHGTIFVFRTIMTIAGTNVLIDFSNSFFNILPYFDALIVGLLWTFGFIIMVNQRLNSEISVAKKHFELIFETSPDASIISRMSDGMIVDCNEGYLRISGNTKEEIIGKSSLDINIWRDPSDRNAVVDMIREKGFCDNYELLFQRKDGKEITGLLSAKQLLLKGVPHIISVTRDISSLKNVEAELKLKNEQLKSSNAEKDRFFSLIAHDLRSPFNTLLGLTQIMVEELPHLTKPELSKMAKSLRNTATNNFNLLENLLQWARIHQGRIPFEPEIFELFPIINDCKTVVTESARMKNIEIVCDIPNDLEIFADRNILQTVIRNLVSNSVKFTPKGGTINIFTDKTADKSVVIAVKDNGIGISKEMIDKLFRLDEFTSRHGTEGEPSSGLGLIICKDFVEMHKGKLWVESEQDKGSAFYISIPPKQ